MGRRLVSRTSKVVCLLGALGLALSGGCSQGAPNYAQGVAESIGILVDNGEGYRRTIIEGQASQERDGFLSPLRSATIELWLGDRCVATTQSNLEGHFVFHETIADGEYVVRAARCFLGEARVDVGRERRLQIRLQLPESCAQGRK